MTKSHDNLFVYDDDDDDQTGVQHVAIQKLVLCDWLTNWMDMNILIY